MLLVVDLFHRQRGVNEGQDLLAGSVLGQKRIPALKVGLDTDDDCVGGACRWAGGGARSCQKRQGDDESCLEFHADIVAATAHPVISNQFPPALPV